jgi:hypothetical protein
MTYITPYPLSGAHVFNAAWTVLHMLQERVPRSLLALGTQL